MNAPRPPLDSAYTFGCWCRCGATVLDCPESVAVQFRADHTFPPEHFPTVFPSAVIGDVLALVARFAMAAETGGDR